MQNGEIGAGLFSDQFIQKFLDDGTLRIVRSITTDEDFKNETCCIYAVAQDLCENSPITVKKMTRAHEAARKWIMANREEAIKLMLENKWASGEFETADRDKAAITGILYTPSAGPGERSLPLPSSGIPLKGMKKTSPSPDTEKKGGSSGCDTGLLSFAALALVPMTSRFGKKAR